jgi:hypothetical protein
MTNTEGYSGRVGDPLAAAGLSEAGDPWSATPPVQAPPPGAAWQTTPTPADWSPPAASTGGYEEPSTADVAKDQAASVAGGAADAAKNVAGVAKEQAAQVATEARQQVRNLVGQARSELTDQAQVQQDRAAKGLHSLADQLRSMAAGSSQPGVATDLAHEAADKARQFAGFLENRDPGSVLDEVRSFARQRPGVFLALSLGAGIVAGRLARGLAADPEDTGAPSTSAATLSRQPPARPVLDPSPTSVAGTLGSAGFGDEQTYGGAGRSAGFGDEQTYGGVGR